MLRKYVGTATEHIVYEGEAVGAILGAHLIGEELRHRVAATDTSISLNNTAFIKVLPAQGARPGKHLVDEFIAMTDKLSDTYSAIGYGLTVRWISGHSGADGNKLADEEAKWAAQGNSNNITELPDFPRGTLPHSASALRQNYTSSLIPRWRKKWEKSPRYRKMTWIDVSLPSDRYFEIIKSLPNAVTALLTQLRTGHAPLNKHLRAISAAESPHCQHCEGVPESVQHFLLNCLHYRSQRHQLRRGLGCRANNLSYLLTSAKAIPHVVDFVNATHHLRTTFGVIRLEADRRQSLV